MNSLRRLPLFSSSITNHTPLICSMRTYQTKYHQQTLSSSRMSLAKSIKLVQQTAKCNKNQFHYPQSRNPSVWRLELSSRRFRFRCVLIYRDLLFSSLTFLFLSSTFSSPIHRPKYDAIPFAQDLKPPTSHVVHTSVSRSVSGLSLKCFHCGS